MGIFQTLAVYEQQTLSHSTGFKKSAGRSHLKNFEESNVYLRQKIYYDWWTIGISI